MPIDWDAATAEAEQREQGLREQAGAIRRARREAYLNDRERIEREQPEAVEIAVRMLRSTPERYHSEIRDAAEVADLETLRIFQRTLPTQVRVVS